MVETQCLRFALLCYHYVRRRHCVSTLRIIQSFWDYKSFTDKYDLYRKVETQCLRLA